MMIEIQDYPPILSGKNKSLKVISESRKGAQIVIVYDEQVGFKSHAVKQCSIARHVKWLDAECFTYRWFETYLDNEDKVQIAEWEAIYEYDSKDTVKFVDAKRLRSVVSFKEIQKLGKVA